MSADDPYRADFVDAADIVFFSAVNHPDPAPLMRAYWSRNPRLIQIAGMGARGCARGQDGVVTFHQPPQLDWPVLDTNGAGDALAVGYLAASVLDGHGPERALRWGQIAARRTCAQRVPKRALARKSDLGG